MSFSPFLELFFFSKNGREFGSWGTVGCFVLLLNDLLGEQRFWLANQSCWNCKFSSLNPARGDSKTCGSPNGRCQKRVKLRSLKQIYLFQSRPISMSLLDDVTETKSKFFFWFCFFKEPQEKVRQEKVSSREKAASNFFLLVEPLPASVEIESFWSKDMATVQLSPFDQLSQRELWMPRLSINVFRAEHLIIAVGLKKPDCLKAWYNLQLYRLRQRYKSSVKCGVW